MSFVLFDAQSARSCVWICCRLVTNGCRNRRRSNGYVNSLSANDSLPTWCAAAFDGNSAEFPHAPLRRGLSCPVTFCENYPAQIPSALSSEKNADQEIKLS